MSATSDTVLWNVVLVVETIFGLVAGSLRRDQGGQFWEGFGWGFLFGPLGLLIVAVTKPKAGTRECSYCRERMHEDATVCPHCQRDLTVRVLDARRDPAGRGLRRGSTTSGETIVAVDASTFDRAAYAEADGAPISDVVFTMEEGRSNRAAPAASGWAFRLGAKLHRRHAQE